LSEKEKHPFIFPKRHHVTKLIVQHYHELVGHSGTQHVLAATREKFWILHGYTGIPRFAITSKNAGNAVYGRPKEINN